MKTQNIPFHHKTIKSDSENFVLIKKDYDERNVDYDTVENGIKRKSDSVDVNLPSLEDFAGSEKGEAILTQLLVKLVQGDAAFRKALTAGEDLPATDLDYFYNLVTSSKGSGITRFDAAERKEQAKFVMESHFDVASMPKPIVDAITACLESGCSKSKLTQVNNMDFIQNLMLKLVELAEKEGTAERTAQFLTVCATSINDFIEAKAAEAEALAGFEF